MASRLVNIRFPEDLYDALRVYAKENGKSISETIFSACERFLDSSPPGLCLSCHPQNELIAQYYQQCNNPPSSETISFLQTQIDELKASIDTQIKEAIEIRLTELLSGDGALH